jgi:tetratricopeptide (TPR) repeat protein
LLGNHREVAIVLYNIVTIHLENGDDEAALKFYQETLEVERAALGPDHADMVMTLQNLAHLHHQRGELEQALMYFREALSIQ